MRTKTKREGWEWYCFGKCEEFVELNTDREMNVCGQCQQPTIALRPVESPESKVPSGEERAERRQEASVEAMRDPVKAHEWFEQMRKAVA